MWARSGLHVGLGSNRDRSGLEVGLQQACSGLEPVWDRVLFVGDGMRRIQPNEGTRCLSSCHKVFTDDPRLVCCCRVHQSTRALQSSGPCATTAFASRSKDRVAGSEREKRTCGARSAMRCARAVRTVWCVLFYEHNIFSFSHCRLQAPLSHKHKLL